MSELTSTPTVTVMMPVYNGRRLIEASIKSLLNQTFTDWECIIVNDGSTDGTAEYLATLTDPRFRTVTFEKNKGRAYARETALNLASGKFLAMLDADDIYHPEKLERQVKLLKENPEIALVGCAICSFGTNSELTYKRRVTAGIFSYHGNIPSHASSMLRMARAQSFHYNLLLNYAEDTDFLNQYLEGQKYMITEEVLYYYSEIDSVTKRKHIAYYKNGIRHALSKGKAGFPLLVKNGLKLILGSIIYPFIPIENILKKRGIPLSNAELQEYKSIVQKIISQAL